MPQKRITKIFRIISIIGIILFLIMIGFGVKSGISKNDAMQKKETASFKEFTDNVFKNEIVKNTMNLHYTLSDPKAYGITDYNITLGELSKESINQSVKELKQYQRELLSFSYDKLSSDEQLTYDILDYYFNRELKSSDFTLYSEILSPTIGIQANLPILFAEYDFIEKKDIDTYLILLSQLDEYYGSIIEFQNTKAKNGLFMPDYAVDDIVEQCESFLSTKEENYLVTIFNNKINKFSDLTEEEKSLYIQKNNEIVSKDVIPAYQLLIGGLSSLKGKSINDKGLCYIENGKKYYEYVVKCNTGSSRSIPELKSMIAAKMDQDLISLVSIVEENPSIITSSGNYDFKLNDPKLILEDLEDKIQEDFPLLPDTPYEIKYVDESLKEHLSPAFYLTPTIDRKEVNTIYINPYHQYTKINLYTTLAHEGYPGHLYQSVFSNSSSPDKVRTLLSFPGFTEGWATYVELYSYQLADIDGSLANLLQVNNSLTLGIYASIDIGIHYDGWSLNDTSAYLGYYGIDDKQTAQDIYYAIVEEPANYLKYYIGYLEILSLKESAQVKLGDSFVLKDFHEFLLTTGPAPFEIIETYMDKWVKNYEP